MTYGDVLFFLENDHRGHDDDLLLNQERLSEMEVEDVYRAFHYFPLVVLEDVVNDHLEEEDFA